MLLLFLPFNPPQACREFGAVCFMMCHASILPPGNSHQSFHSPYPRCVAKIRPCSSKITAATTSIVFIFNFYYNDGFVIMVQRYCFFLTCAMGCVFLGRGKGCCFMKKTQAIYLMMFKRFLFSATATDCMVGSNLSLFRLHCQRTMTCQPACVSSS